MNSENCNICNNLIAFRKSIVTPVIEVGQTVTLVKDYQNNSDLSGVPTSYVCVGKNENDVKIFILKEIINEHALQKFLFNLSKDEKHEPAKKDNIIKFDRNKKPRK